MRRTTSPRRRCTCGVVTAGLLLALAGWSAAQRTDTEPQPCAPIVHDDAAVLRREKCAYLWQRVAPWSYSPQLCEHFISEHERLGIGPEWFASITYGLANFGLTVGKQAPGLCYGPMDVKWGGYARRAGCRKPSDLRDPYRNITAHCLEAQVGVGKGYTGLALCRYIMYPARPHDWGGGRFRKTWARLERELRGYYARD